jgi:hypothetical protein
MKSEGIILHCSAAESGSPEKQGPQGSYRDLIYWKYTTYLSKKQAAPFKEVTAML